MYVVINNLYGNKDNSKAYWRRQGLIGFDFVNDKEYATSMPESKCKEIIEKGKQMYLNMFKAESITIEE